jgi:DtxR family manganese transport transcriptional regulator
MLNYVGDLSREGARDPPMKGTPTNRAKSSAGRHSTTNGYVRTRRDHRMELAEDYVELIDDLIRERGEARAVDVAGRLGVSHVTVSRTIRRLREAGWVISKPYRSIFLTDAGRQMARHSRERHRQVLDFLLALGVPRNVAVVDAEGLEHHVSETTLEHMRRFTASRKNA